MLERCVCKGLSNPDCLSTNGSQHSQTSDHFSLSAMYGRSPGLPKPSSLRRIRSTRPQIPWFFKFTSPAFFSNYFQDRKGHPRGHRTMIKRLWNRKVSKNSGFGDKIFIPRRTSPKVTGELCCRFCLICHINLFSRAELYKPAIYLENLKCSFKVNCVLKGFMCMAT